MPKTLIRENPAVDPSLLALKPRQVLLANLTAMKKPSSGKASSSALTADQKASLLQAVAQFLDRSGFSKTLKKFRSEAQVEKDGQKGSTLDLEEIYHKYLEMWNLSIKEVSNQDKQDTKNEGTSKRDEEHDSTEAVETGSKKNNKISKLSNSNNANEIITNDAAPELNIRSKKTKKSKRISDSLGQGAEQFNTEISKGPAGLIVCVSHMEDEHDKKSKGKKKKKSKSDSGSLVNSVEHPLLESLPGATEEKSVERSRDAQANNSSATAEDKSVKSKGKKKKKDNLEDLETGDVNANHSKENDCETLDDDVANNKKKSSKKRKRLASEENDLQPVDKKAAEESKRRKVEGLQQSERSDQPAEVNASPVSDGQANGSLEENGEKPAFQKTKNQHNGSVEPKTANAFRRIKAEEVIFTDKRLEDNSYWAKDGAESGYGAKAQEILGQVRGRDFRHEKTKKKRGTYRGGQIDLQSHSVKFNYSDEE